VEVVLYKLRLEKVFFPITSTSYSFVTDITSIRITVEVSSLVKCNARAHTHTHTHTHTHKFELTDMKLISFYLSLLFYLQRGSSDLRPLLFWHIERRRLVVSCLRFGTTYRSLEDGTDILYQNIGNTLPAYAA